MRYDVSSPCTGVTDTLLRWKTEFRMLITWFHKPFQNRTRKSNLSVPQCFLITYQHKLWKENILCQTFKYLFNKAYILDNINLFIRNCAHSILSNTPYKCMVEIMLCPWDIKQVYPIFHACLHRMLYFSIPGTYHFLSETNVLITFRKKYFLTTNSVLQSF